MAKLHIHKSEVNHLGMGQGGVDSVLVSNSLVAPK